MCFRQVSAPDSAVGSLQHSPEPLDGLEGPLFERRWKEERMSKGKGGRGRGETYIQIKKMKSGRLCFAVMLTTHILRPRLETVFEIVVANIHTPQS